jgi:hypothetical protein
MGTRLPVALLVTVAALAGGTGSATAAGAFADDAVSTGTFSTATVPKVRNLRCTGTLTSSRLEWSPPADTTGVTGYRVRPPTGAPVDQTGTTFTLSQLNLAGSYTVHTRRGSWESAGEAITVVNVLGLAVCA